MTPAQRKLTGSVLSLVMLLVIELVCVGAYLDLIP